MNREVGLAFQAWLVGLATAALVVLPGATALDGLLSDPFLETLPVRVLAFFVLMLPGVLMTFTVGILMSAPFFLIGLIVALTCRGAILRHPLAMAAAAPVLTMIIVAVVSAWTMDNDWALARPFGARFLGQLLRGDTLIFALPVAAGSFWFCLRLARDAGGKRPGPE
jgi:hypothetical protein